MALIYNTYGHNNTTLMAIYIQHLWAVSYTHLNNVGIVPGSNYGFDNFIKLNFSRINQKDINIGISLLKETIEFFINLDI